MSRCAHGYFPSQCRHPCAWLRATRLLPFLALTAYRRRRISRLIRIPAVHVEVEPGWILVKQDDQFWSQLFDQNHDNSGDR